MRRYSDTCPLVGDKGPEIMCLAGIRTRPRLGSEMIRVDTLDGICGGDKLIREDKNYRCCEAGRRRGFPQE